MTAWLPLKDHLKTKLRSVDVLDGG